MGQEQEQVRERQLEPVELWEPVELEQVRERPVWRWERQEALESLERPVWRWERQEELEPQALRWAPRVPECLAQHREGCPLLIELGQGLRLSMTRPH